MRTPFRRMLGNLGLLVRGRGIAAVMLLGSTLLMARTLDPSEFGMVMLTLAYTMLIRGFFDFQLFESVIRFGVPAQEAGDMDKLRRLISLCWSIDLRAAIAATFVGLLIAPIAGMYSDLPQHSVYILQGYSLVLLSTGNGTSIGVLRFLDRFDLLSKLMVVGPAFRFSGVVVSWWLNAGLEVFLAVFAFAYIIENISLIWCGRLEYKNKIGLIPLVNGKKKRDFKVSEFEGLRSFLWVNYWQSNLDISPKHIVVMLAGALLGATEAGLLRLARELSTVLASPALLVRQVLFLDLTRSWHQKSSEFKSLAYRTALVGGLVGFVFVLISYFFGELLLDHLVGLEYVAAAPLLTLMLLAATFDLSASSLRSAAYAIGHAARVLRLYIISTVVYITAFAGFTWWFGLIGAGLAACASAILPPVVMFIMIHKSEMPSVKVETSDVEN